jgi:hypothetical protein
LLALRSSYYRDKVVGVLCVFRLRTSAVLPISVLYY